MKIIDKDHFYKTIIGLIDQYDMSIIEAVVDYCERREVEIETAAGLLKENQKLLQILTTEGESLNYLPKSAKLPI